MSGKIKLGVAAPHATARSFVDAWNQAERGDVPSETEERLHFEDLATLLRALTPARWALLQELRGGGPCSVRALSKRLRRDYKNVHTDVGVLERLGLITRTADGEVQVPWETIVAELRLAA